MTGTQAIAAAALFVATSAALQAAGTPAGLHSKPVARPRGLTTPAVAAPAITNDDVIKMARGGLTEVVILTAIRGAGATAFTLTPDALVHLKASGVTDNIISLMLDPRAPVAAATVPAPISKIDVPKAERDLPDDPTSPHEPGIYIDLGTASAHKLVPLEPTVFTQGKTGGVLTSALTYGLKKAKWKAIVRGRTSNLRLRDQQPVFYFYFESRGSGLSHTGGSTGWMTGASSPNEFVLAAMDQTSAERQLVVGEFGLLGASSGTRSKDTVDLTIERLSPGIYRVTPSRTLEVTGEYCLFYAASSQLLGGGVTGKLFDFGIDGK